MRKENLLQVLQEEQMKQLSSFADADIFFKDMTLKHNFIMFWVLAISQPFF